MKTILYNFGKKIIDVISLIVLTIILLMNCAGYVHYSMEDGQRMFVNNQWYHWIVAIFFVIALIMVGYFIFDKLSPRKFFVVATILYLLAGAFFVFCIDSKIDSDPWMIYKYLDSFLSGDFHGLDKGYYFGYFPGQLGMLTYELPFYLLFKSTKFFFLLNLVWILCSIFLLLRLVEMVAPGRSRLHNYVVLFSFGFLPVFFHSAIIYGQIPGNLCVLLACYLAVSSFREDSINIQVIKIIISAVFIGIACVVRQNYLVSAIALCITVLLFFLKDTRSPKMVRINLLAIAFILACAIGIPTTVINTYKKISNIDFSDRGANVCSLDRDGITG